MSQLLIDSFILFIAFFWQAYAQALIITCLFNLTSSVKQNLLYSIILSVYTVLSKMLLPLEYSFINTILAFTISYLEIKYIYKTSFFIAFISIFIPILLSIPAETIGGLVLFKIFKFETNIENVIGTLPLLIFVNLWFTLIYFCLHLFKNKSILNFFHNSEISNKKSIYANVLLVVLIISPNIMFYATNQYNYPFYLLIFNIIANLLLVILSIYNTYKNVQLEKNKQELSLSNQHNKTLNALLDSIRTFKHDYSNIIHSIGGYITFGDMEGLEKFYNGLMRETKKAGQLESISPNKITEPSVYTLFATKHEDAHAKDILFCVETMFDYKKLAMPIFDFCKILGIFLDNAIEAAEESIEKEINVSFRRSNSDHIQIFTIENTYKDKDIDTEKIFEKDYSTKNRNSGIGLWEVKNIIDKNKNVTLLTSKDEKFFTQKLIISEETLIEHSNK